MLIHSRRAGLKRLAGVVLATGVLASLLAGLLPLETLASGQMCTLSCCAGRAPHAAGSCMDGSCHTFLKGRVRALPILRKSSAQRSEQFCGLPRVIARITARSLIQSATLTVGDASQQLVADLAREGANASTSTFGQPCQRDCGVGAFSSSSQNRPRETGAPAYAHRPRPPSNGRHEHSPSNRAMALDALSRRSRPRGPPISS